jgi:hypothetical protein
MRIQLPVTAAVRILDIAEVIFVFALGDIFGWYKVAAQCIKRFFADMVHIQNLDL